MTSHLLLPVVTLVFFCGTLHVALLYWSDGGTSEIPLALD
ncbi:hypothetical protein MicloDRAFT_00030550 [Microvirga lotononidis]|uniref:Uncharacterized protein n=1 Tax=Microvirga lotononidis TaxID=864069 RepID=I4YRB4_9HYPH|nr:hypothetical protein MicloDRAFT_00030550 [Microvirga lotononidis]